MYIPTAHAEANVAVLHEFIKEMVREAMDPYGEVMTVGELPATPDAKEILRFVSAKERELNMVFHFDMVYTGMGTVRKYIPEPFDLRDVKKSLSKWQKFIQGTDMWTTSFAENHDSARSISRFRLCARAWSHGACFTCCHGFRGTFPIAGRARLPPDGQNALLPGRKGGSGLPGYVACEQVLEVAPPF